MYAIKIFDEGEGGKLIFYRKTSNGLEEAGMVTYEDSGERKHLIEIFTERRPNVEMM